MRWYTMDKSSLVDENILFKQCWDDSIFFLSLSDEPIFFQSRLTVLDLLMHDKWFEGKKLHEKPPSEILLPLSLEVH